MTDLQKARRLCLKLIKFVVWYDDMNFESPAAEDDRQAANTIRDLCDEEERLQGVVNDFTQDASQKGGGDDQT